MLTNKDDFLLVSLLENFLGSPRTSKDAESRVDWEFNCPSKTCRKDQDKFNLTYQAREKVFNCWKCKYRGFIYRLVRDYGKAEDLRRLKLILPEHDIRAFNIFKKPEIDYDLVTCDLPKGYLPLNRVRQSNLYQMAWNYAVNVRKITPAQIDKYRIGYTETGPRKFRIIIPSFNVNDKINYFEARAYLKDAKVPYLKPDSPYKIANGLIAPEVACPGPDKNDIIFNEKFINWDLPIYLVEGVFDAIRLPNAIAMLGKSPSELLLSKLIKHNATVIICLDSDAVRDGMEIYEKLRSLGLNVFFIDLKGKKDISKTYEDGGQDALNELLGTICRIDEVFKFNKLLNE